MLSNLGPSQKEIPCIQGKATRPWPLHLGKGREHRVVNPQPTHNSLHWPYTPLSRGRHLREGPGTREWA